MIERNNKEAFKILMNDLQWAMFNEKGTDGINHQKKVRVCGFFSSLFIFLRTTHAMFLNSHSISHTLMIVGR